MSVSKIKNFFKKKKDAAKFMTAGPGRKLNATDDSAASSSQPKKSRDVYIPPNRVELSAEARAAAEAAMARTQKKDSKEFNTSLAAIRMQVKRELEAEKQEKLCEEQSATASNKPPEPDKNLAVSGVFFRCALISDEILPRNEWKTKIKDFLYEQLEQEKGLTACLIIHNCNVKEKAELCTETLTKYIENIVNNPDEEKYRKIRMSNRAFCDRVRGVEGGYEFLIGAGFVEQTIDDDTFLIYSADNSVDVLPELLDALRNAEKITLDLDRNIQVLLPSQARKFQLPPDFFRVKPEELKKEQKLRSDAIENAQLLKTKAMREREELRTISLYKFSLIRVRFPDGVFLQGTFSVYEKVADVYDFVRSCLKDESFEFILAIPAGPKLGQEDFEKTLFELRLVPSVLLTFVYDNMSTPTGNYLKEDLLMLIQPI